MNTNETKSFLEKIKNLPPGARIASLVVLVLAACIYLFTSCGTPRTAVTINDGGTSHVESNTTSSTTTTITIKSDKND